MRRVLFFVLPVVLVVGACSSGDDGEDPISREGLLGHWMNTSLAGDGRVGLTFNSDGTYNRSILLLTSTTAADAEVETGMYVATDTHLTLLPQRWTCPSPAPVSMASYAVSGNDLIVTTPFENYSFAASASPASSRFALRLGCFDFNGVLTPAPLAPVTYQ
jgi:hypothetical protein